jgi:hypothetical protein
MPLWQPFAAAAVAVPIVVAKGILSARARHTVETDRCVALAGADSACAAWRAAALAAAAARPMHAANSTPLRLHLPPPSPTPQRRRGHGGRDELCLRARLHLGPPHPAAGQAGQGPDAQLVHHRLRRVGCAASGAVCAAAAAWGWFAGQQGAPQWRVEPAARAR